MGSLRIAAIKLRQRGSHRMPVCSALRSWKRATAPSWSPAAEHAGTVISPSTAVQRMCECGRLCSTHGVTRAKHARDVNARNDVGCGEDSAGSVGDVCVGSDEECCDCIVCLALCVRLQRCSASFPRCTSSRVTSTRQCHAVGTPLP